MRQIAPRLKAQIVKELLSILRDPRSRMILIVPPLIQLLIFSFAATLEVKNVDVGVYNRDSGRWSHELMARVDAAPFVARVHLAPTRDALQGMVDQRVVIAGLEIPEDFSRDIAAHRKADVQLLVDGRRANAGQLTYGYLNAIANGLGAELASGGRADGKSVTEIRHWFNPNLNHRWYVVPGLAGILTTFVSLLVTALSIARERELGTFDQLLVSPTTPLEIIFVKAVPALIIGTILGSIMVAAGVFGFGIPFTGSFLLLILSLMLFILSVVGIGLMISSVCATQQQAILGTFAVGVPTALMSGFATPVENMPVFLQWLAQAVPLKHFIPIVEGTFVKALPPAEVYANAWPLAAIAVVTLTVSVIFVRSRLQ